MPRNYVMTLAPMRFTQPSIMMLVVGVASLPMENQHPETCLMPGAILLGVGRLQTHSCDKWLVTAEDNIQYGGHFTSHLAQIRDSWPSHQMTRVSGGKCTSKATLSQHCAQVGIGSF